MYTETVPLGNGTMTDNRRSERDNRARAGRSVTQWLCARRSVTVRSVDERFVGWSTRSRAGMRMQATRARGGHELSAYRTRPRAALRLSPAGPTQPQSSLAPCRDSLAARYPEILPLPPCGALLS